MYISSVLSPCLSAVYLQVVQLVRHIRAQHGDDPDYDNKIKEARLLEAKVQSSGPRKVPYIILYMKYHVIR